MHRSESYLPVPCAVCGTAVAEDSRGYSFGEREMLCWDCAVKRGGSYDAEEDRWVTNPSTADLPLEKD